MKKTLCCVILLIVIVSLMMCPVSAAEINDNDINEIKSLTRETYDMFITLYESTNDDSYDYDYNMSGKDMYCSCGLRGLMYSRRADEYRKWSDLKTIVYSRFTKEAGDNFIKYMHGFEHNGYTYSSWHLPQAQTDGVYIDYEGIASFDESFKVISHTPDSITASFDVAQFGTLDEGAKSYTFEYIKTTDGWRISGGTFADTFFCSSSGYQDSTAPPTGDGAVMLLALAVVSASVAFVCKRRIRSH